MGSLQTSIVRRMRWPFMKRFTRQDALAAVGKALREHGYAPRRGVWKWPMRDGVWGWLGLNTGQGYDEGSWLINPVVGVRHDQIEDLVMSFLPPTRTVAFTPTLSSNYGHYRQPPEYLEFTLRGQPTDEAVVRLLAETIDAEGKAAATPMQDLSVLRARMKANRIGIPHEIQLRYPIVCVLCGDGDEADRTVSELLEGCTDQSNPYHVHVRKYLEAFQRWRVVYTPES